MLAVIALPVFGDQDLPSIERTCAAGRSRSAATRR